MTGRDDLPFHVGDRVWTPWRNGEHGTVRWIKEPSFPGAAWKVTVDLDLGGTLEFYHHVLGAEVGL